AQEQAVVGGLTGQLAGLNEILSSGEIRAAELQVVSHTDGTILDIPVEAGQVVSAGVTLVQIGSTGTLEIKTELLSDEIRRVNIGQDAWITAPVLDDQAISGQVTKIYPQAFEKTSALGVVQRRVPVIISIDEIGNLQPGYEVRVAIETVHKEGVILLPRESVRLNDDGEYQVLAIIDGKVEFLVVELGEKSQQWVEILEGIEVDQFVCRDASRELKEGTRVKGVLNGERI
ncbi:MAG: HlyD family efflux transporter periplasmic adaptor subunit, partial [Syntrophomonadaceae bacterium]|nr:HlyD family efflux transporter periplasmic adaptor subunit [Syntrophomonadaceae bacterium]